MSDFEEAAKALLFAYAAAVYSKDVEAFAACYTQDVRVFDAWGVWSYEGIAAWREMATGWFASLGEERVGVDFDEERFDGGDRLGTVTALVTYQGLAADGTEARAMQNRITWVLRRKGDAWRIAHEHTSAPIDFDSLKAMLNR